jgi:hypothetical protein
MLESTVISLFSNKWLRDNLLSKYLTDKKNLLFNP